MGVITYCQDFLISAGYTLRIPSKKGFNGNTIISNFEKSNISRRNEENRTDFLRQSKAHQHTLSYSLLFGDLERSDVFSSIFSLPLLYIFSKN